MPRERAATWLKSSAFPGPSGSRGVVFSSQGRVILCTKVRRVSTDGNGGPGQQNWDPRSHLAPGPELQPTLADRLIRRLTPPRKVL